MINKFSFQSLGFYSNGHGLDQAHHNNLKIVKLFTLSCSYLAAAIHSIKPCLVLLLFIKLICMLTEKGSSSQLPTICIVVLIVYIDSEILFSLIVAPKTVSNPSTTSTHCIILD